MTMFNGFTPEQQTRAQYAHRISMAVQNLRNNYKAWQDVHVDDGRLANATPAHATQLQDLLRKELGDPEITIEVIRTPLRAITPMPCAQQSFAVYVLQILNEFYSGRRGKNSTGSPNYRRTMEARHRGGEVVR